MPANRIDGRKLASAHLARLQAEVTEFTDKFGAGPKLAVVRVGADQASASYARQIRRTFERRGASSVQIELPADAGTEQILAEIDRLNADPDVHGIMLQAPLPPSISWREVADAVAPPKDVDGATSTNLGLLAAGDSSAIPPATPAGGMEILRASGAAVVGSLATVVGRSNVVGLPMALMLVRAHSTVTVCHTRTPDMAAACKSADILCVAAGRADLITADMVKPGAVVLDFGVNFVDGKMVGDVAIDEVARVAGAITPVPGGTGPMTNVCLLANTLRAAQVAMEKASIHSR